MSADDPLVKPLREDHALCLNELRMDDVRHMCCLEFGHWGVHQCSCDRFWVNRLPEPQG